MASIPQPSGDPFMERSRELLISNALEVNATRWPDRSVLTIGERTATFGELERASGRVAHALRARGIGHGDHVATLLPNRVELVEVIFALWRVGAVWVPLNYRLAAPEVHYIVEHSDAALAFVDDARGGDVPTGVDTVSVDTDDYERMRSSGPPQAPEPPAGQRDVDPAVIMYTSGTTGRPKGAVLPHRAVMYNALTWAHTVGIRDRDVYLSGFPLFHIGGIVGFFPFLLRGQQTVILPTGGYDPREAARVAARSGVTVMGLVPAQMEGLSTLPDEDLELLADVRRIVWGGSPAPRPLLERLADRLDHARVIATYGLTEVCGNAAYMPADQDRERMEFSGIPAAGMEVRIVDEGLREVPAGEVGEIVCRGPQLMQGYYADEEATSAAFAGGWFHTGDDGLLDEEGFLKVVDRRKDMFISGGENVYPSEIERVLAQHPAVREVGVGHEPHEQWGQVPVAVVVPASEGAIDEAEVRRHCREQLAAYKVPKRVVIADALPRNALGKVLKRELSTMH